MICKAFKQFYTLVVVVALSCVVQSAQASRHVVNYMPPAANNLQQGFMRITNRENTTTIVSLWAIDDKGNSLPSAAPLTISMDAGETKGFTIADLETGNTAKGLSGGLGAGTGDWRLFFSAKNRLDVAAYIRSPNGFLTSIHESSISDYQGVFHQIAIFNPAKNTDQQSKIRIINNALTSNTITIKGYDDKGVQAQGGDLTLTLDKLEAITLTSSDLEHGLPGSNLQGAFGAGQGKWRLSIYSSVESSVVNLMEVPGGYLSNLSTVTQSPPSVASDTFNCSDFDGASIYSQETVPVYLGFFGDLFVGGLGKSNSPTSLLNSNSIYGSKTGDYSAFSPSAKKPPIVVKNGRVLGYLTVQTDTNRQIGNISFWTLSPCFASKFSAAKPDNPFLNLDKESINH